MYSILIKINKNNNNKNNYDFQQCPTTLAHGFEPQLPMGVEATLTTRALRLTSYKSVQLFLNRFRVGYSSKVSIVSSRPYPAANTPSKYSISFKSATIFHLGVLKMLSEVSFWSTYSHVLKGIAPCRKRWWIEAFVVNGIYFIKLELFI